MSREQLKDAWLRLPIGFKDKNIFNPLEHIPPEFEENPHLYILFLLQRPEYLSFAAREILNVKLLPIQNLILQQMWTHKFPMVIASRGFGKCERDSYVESQSGFHKIDELCDGLAEMEKRYTPNLTLKGMNGYKEVEYVWRNKKDKVYIIETHSGFRKICSPTHPIKIVRGREIDWEHAQKIKVGDYIPIVRDDSWFPNPDTSVTEEFGWTLGQLFGLGGFEGDKFCIRMPGQYKEGLNKLTLKHFHSTARIAKLKKKRLGKATYWFSKKFLPQFLKYTSRKMDFPKILLSSPKPVMTAFISGLFSHKMQLDRRARRISLFCQNEDFARTLQFIFTKYGIIAHILKKKYNGKIYHLLVIYGEDTLRFNEKFNIIRKCKKRILESYKSWPKFSRDIIPNSLYNTSVKREGRRIHFTYNNIPYDCDNRELIERHYYYDKVKKITESEDDTYDVYIPGDHTFYASGFISHNSFMMGVYCLLRMLLLPGRSIVVAGSAFRQSKIIFGYMENIWRNAPLLRDLFSNENFNGPRREPDMYRFHLGDSITRAIPVGDGQTIRGLRANDIIVDEFASLSRDVFEVVIQGFAAVRSDPFSGVEYEAMKEYAKRMNIQLSEDEQRMDQNNENQIVISGTAYYDFNHFAEYHKKYHKIICSKGDLSKVSDSLEEYEKNDSLDWRQRCIIRIPYELIPKGFMDDGIVMAAKATSHIGLFDMEYRATFSKDSHGFFKRSLIESCVVSPNNPIILPSGPVDFTARMFGDSHKKYVFGVDVASEIDRFAINIIEIHDDHRRIVYGWSTNRKEFNQKVKTGLIKDTDYYGHCARKIRDLMKVFPCVRIMMDSQGGGIGVMEALHDVEKLEIGEELIWPVIDPYKPADTDGKAGKHILEMVNFANAEWTSEANHGMKKDLEDKALIFPYFDPVSIELATIEDGKSGKLYDTFEDCLMEIEELKNELSTIVISQTSTGRDRWDTPEIKLPGNKKGRLRKDRYSALLMANMGARILLRNPHQKLISSDGGGFSKHGKSKGDGRKYTGPEWLTRSLEDLYE